MVFHFILNFTESYPATPPAVDLCTFLPHPNVFPKHLGKRNHICLDMLDGSAAGAPNGTGLSGWTSAYSVQSLLVQLSTFLLDESKVLSASHCLLLLCSFSFAFLLTDSYIVLLCCAMVRPTPTTKAALWTWR